MRVNVPNYSPILISSNYYFLEIMSHYRFIEIIPTIVKLKISKCQLPSQP